MELRTEIHIPESAIKIDHHQKIYLTGSCFSENILAKFRYFGFDALANSHGIIYNPDSIAQCLDDLVKKRKYTEADLNNYNGKYFSYSHHGEFDSAEPAAILENINSRIEAHHTFLQQAKVIFITLGTAWAYIDPLTGKIVANCHKMPASNFSKICMSSLDVEENLEEMITNIRTVNRLANIIFTLSPVKHLKDGFVENQLSKSLLHIAIQQQLGEKVHYFPAYEIMNDDLRDYRFWKEDMVHPNQLAIDYIWEKLSDTYFASSTMEVMEEVKKLRQFIDHRPLTNDPARIDELNREKEKKKAILQEKYPQLNL